MVKKKKKSIYICILLSGIVSSFSGTARRRRTIPAGVETHLYIFTACLRVHNIKKVGVYMYKKYVKKVAPPPLKS